jgi:hypothetical protein
MKFFTQEHARFIAKKLQMDITPGRDHDLATFRHSGKDIVRFGIRRGSKELPHSYIPSQLHLTAKECRELHGCKITPEQFIEGLKAKKLIPEDPKREDSKENNN